MSITFSKKTVVALAIGTVMTCGAVLPTLAQAADFSGDYQEYHQRHHTMFPEMTQQLGISKADFEKYQAKGYSHKDVAHAAFLAKASGKTLDKVLSYKTEDTTWKYVVKKLGVTKEQMKNTRQDMMAEGISSKTGSDKNAILNLCKQGYHGRDIMMAAELAKHSSTPLNEIIGMKKINNSWKDVAASLGVKEDTIKQDFKAMHQQVEQQ